MACSAYAISHAELFVVFTGRCWQSMSFSPCPHGVLFGRPRVEMLYVEQGGCACYYLNYASVSQTSKDATISPSVLMVS